MILQLGLLDRVLNTLKEVDNLVLDEILINFHLALEVSHLCLVDQLQNARCSVFNGPHILVLECQHLGADISFELPIGLVDDITPLLVQKSGILFDELKVLLVAAQKAGEEIESVALVLPARTEAVQADALTAIEA